jgi:predicted RecA/RadA family phage recombinase
MRNFIQPGNSLAIAVPYATGVSAGQGVLVGALFGVAAVDGVQNTMIEAATTGVFDLTKEPALAIAAGVRVFWDNTNRRITATAAGNFQVGISTQAALAADATVRVWLTRAAGGCGYRAGGAQLSAPSRTAMGRASGC